MDYSEFGKFLASKRREKGYSQQKLAELTGISRATINNFENNRVGDISFRKIITMMEILDVELTPRQKSPFPTLEELRNEL